LEMHLNNESNKAAALNAAMTHQFHPELLWRGVSEPHRWDETTAPVWC